MFWLTTAKTITITMTKTKCLGDGVVDTNSWNTVPNVYIRAIDSSSNRSNRSNILTRSTKKEPSTTVSIPPVETTNPGAIDVDSDDVIKAPTNLRYDNLTNTTVRLIWDHSKSNNNVKHYELFIKGSNSDKVSIEIDKNNRNHVVTDLSPHHEYEFWIRAVLENDKTSLPTERITIKTYGYTFIDGKVTDPSGYGDFDVNEALRQRPNAENKIYLIFDESEEYAPDRKYLDAYEEAIEEWNKVMKPQFEVTNRGELKEIIREQGPQTVNILRQSSTPERALGENISTWAGVYQDIRITNRYVDEVHVYLNPDNYSNKSSSFPGLGYRLPQVAVHELGHLLGLSHSYNENAIMSNSPETRSIAPQSDDITAIEALYGRKP